MPLLSESKWWELEEEMAPMPHPQPVGPAAARSSWERLKGWACRMEEMITGGLEREIVPEFSAKIDLGHILQIVVLLTAFAVGWGIFQSRLGENHDALVRMESRQQELEKSVHAFRERQIEIGRALEDHMQYDQQAHGVKR